MTAEAEPRVSVVITGDGDRARTSAAVSRQRGVVATLVDETTVLAALASDLATVLVLVEAGTTLEPGALRRLVDVIHRFSAAIVYTDSTIQVAAQTFAIRRPDFSPLRLLAQDYLGDLVALDVETAKPLLLAGESRAALSGFALRVEPSRVVHIPEPLSHRDSPAKVPALDVRRTAVQRRLDDAGVIAEVDTVAPAGVRIRFPVVGTPLVSIVIPTRGSSASVRGADRVLVVEAVRSIVETSSYAHIEIVVVADDGTPSSVIDELERVAGDRLKVVRWSETFNFSAKINRGAAHASGGYLLLLNDDVEVISADWIETMLSLCQQPGIGMVGANLFFEDGRRQHSGHFYREGVAGHIAFGWAEDDDDALGSLTSDHEVAGVTAACAMITSSMFRRVGGLSSLLPGNYNDVDLSLKVRTAGSRIVWTPWARLFHFESQTRVATSTLSESDRLRGRWGTRMEVDPYWSDLTAPWKSTEGPSRLL